MAIQLTIRNVPEHVRDTLASRAAGEGRSMQEYLLRALEKMAAFPSPSEWAARVREDKQGQPQELSASSILEARDADRR